MNPANIPPDPQRVAAAEAYGRRVAVDLACGRYEAARYTIDCAKQTLECGTTLTAQTPLASFVPLLEGVASAHMQGVVCALETAHRVQYVGELVAVAPHELATTPNVGCIGWVRLLQAVCERAVTDRPLGAG